MKPQLVIAALAAGAAIAFGLLLMPGPEGDLDCRHVALTDSVSGSLVEGAEDMALDPLGGRLILSAYDRRNDRPGGLYAVPLDRLFDPAATLLTAQRLAPSPGSPALRPHGIGVNVLGGDGVAIAAIERHRRAGGASGATVELYVLSHDGLAPAGAPGADPLLCNANDVAVEHKGGYLVTTDRAACTSLGRRLEDILGLARGRLLSVGYDGIRILSSHIGFANGIAEDGARIYVAATRSHELLIFDRNTVAALNPPPPRHVALDAAPDNLAWGDDGALYIAAHVSLLRFALFRLGLRGDSASAIYRYDPAQGPNARPVLIGDANLRGAVSGATVALEAGGHLILGAGFDSGIAVCANKKAGPP